MSEHIGLIVMGAGLFFNFVGALGLVRLPDVYSKLHAVTKGITFGTSLILFGAFIASPLSGDGIKSLFCIFFLNITSPVVAHAIGRGAHRYGVKLSGKSAVDRYAEAQKTRKAGKK